MSDTTEKRYFRTELRVDPEGGKKRVTGMAVPYNEASEDLGGFREMFKPDAFDETLKSSAEIRAGVEHDFGKKLARRSKGTLELDNRQDGLHVAITLPKTSVGSDAEEEVRAGLLDGMSIEFRDAEADWTGRGDDTVRIVKRAKLVGVTLTGYPAYPQTAGTVAMRSLEEYRSTASSTTPDGEKKPEPPRSEETGGAWLVAARRKELEMQ
jgi:HK97 family phage prohead protease